MINRRTLLRWLAGSSIGGLSGFAGYTMLGGQKLTEIKFYLGKNIVQTAKESGVPRYTVERVDTAIIYGVNDIPETVAARYTRPGYELELLPLFAFTIWADTRNGSVADQVVLQFRNKAAKTHAEAQAFVEQTIAQFQRGKWQRYSDPEWDVLLTGRSSMLDERGHIGGELNTIDPAYKIPAEDWPLVAGESPTWRWVGDGVLASLHVLGYKGSSGLDYTITLDFDLLDVKLKRDAENLAQKRKEGDAKGWNSTAKYEAEKKNSAALNKRLIENAIKRGDTVVSPSPMK